MLEEYLLQQKHIIQIKREERTQEDVWEKPLRADNVLERPGSQAFCGHIHFFRGIWTMQCCP